MKRDWLIKTNHTLEEVVPPAGGYELEKLQEMIGGYIQIVPLKVSEITGEQLCAVVNEEGLLRKMPQNDIATMIIGRPIVGDVLICKSKHIK